MALEVEEKLILQSTLNVPEDHKKILEMIADLKTGVRDSSFLEKAYEDFWEILSNFQEQPHLLDGKLDKILNELIDVVMNPQSPKLRIEAFKYLHAVMKVRGYKCAVRYMPHEVNNLEPIVALLESEDLELECWQANYVLLVWLSILVLTPFPMSYFDSPTAVDQLPTMMIRIETIIKKHLMSNVMFHVSANLAASFYGRVDVKEKMLLPFFNWTISVLADEKEGTFCKVAAMAGATAILKRGERGNLIEHAKKLLMALLEEAKDVDNTSLLYRKYRSKLFQRIGLTFLKKRKIKWRYKKGYCSLLQNLTVGYTNSNPPSENDVTSVTDLTSLSSQEETSDEEQFEDDLLEWLSEVIDRLINALEDSDTVVRWSAAKGIARISERLTQQMCNMVLTSIVDIFSERKNHFSWHGACLALAQMGSRGLIPKPRLMEIVKHVIVALIYDEPRRFSSVGENVRDAACYVFWAFARAFNEEDLIPLSNIIITNLLLVALFDREVHCRRAASAAFQEYVGRCSLGPIGIAIMSEADYMSVGIRSNAYLHVSVQIAKIGGFTKAMIQHLVADRLVHWDSVIRDLAAKALNLLSPFEPLFIASFLPVLVEHAYSDALTERLGATLGIGEIVHGLYVTGKMYEYVDDVIMTKVKNIIPDYRRDGRFRGIGGDMMKVSCCRLIWKCSEAMLQVDDIAEDWLFVIQECVYNLDPDSREAAITALHSFLKNYHFETISDRIVREYVSVLSAPADDGDFRQACSASVLGNIPSVVLEKYLDIIIPALIKCTYISAETAFFTESRCMAIKALLYVLTNTNFNNFSKESVHEILSCFLNALDDYTRNKKGDIGCQVRYEATVALFELTKHILNHEAKMLEENVVEKMVPKIMQLALEPQDKLRICAREVFGKLIYHEPEISCIPAISDLKKIFPRELCTDVNWWRCVDTYPHFIEVLLLLEPRYTHHILVGFMMAIGGVSESSVLSVGAVFFEALEDIPLEKACVVARSMLKILSISHNVEHMSCPVLFFFKRLLECGALNNVLLDADTNFAADILSLMKKEMNKSKDFNKIKAIISILSNVTTVKGDVGLEAIQILIRCLKHRSVAVRSATATRMFETLSSLDESAFPGSNLQVVLKLLAETRWKGCAEEYAQAVSKISEEIAHVQISKCNS